MWLPWLAVVIRLTVDLAMGVSLTSSEFFTQAFVPFWPVHSWYVWRVFSWLPLLPLISAALVYAGWRLFWWADDWVPSYRTPTVVLSMLVPPVAPFVLYGDARRRFRQRNAKLQDAVDDAQGRIDDHELSLIR